MSSFYGLIGEKLKHSISPKIHSMIFEFLNINGCYNLFEVDRKNLKAAVDGLKSLGAKGVNVTIPYKSEIMQYVDEVSEEALKIGAINTINFVEGKAKGYNTDYYGFGAMLEKNAVDITGRSAVVLGTGGASKAVVQYLMDKGIRNVTLVTRNAGTSRFKENSFNLIEYNGIKSLKNVDIIINCTPCGMYPDIDCCPVNTEDILKFTTVIDLIYNPEETILLKHAGKMGLKTVNGLYMLAGQAVAAQEIWNNRKINKDIIDDICNTLKHS